jgi:hypothetical protein
MRFNPNQQPFIAPYLLIASIVYALHVGWYLHAFGKRGEMVSW